MGRKRKPLPPQDKYLMVALKTDKLWRVKFLLDRAFQRIGIQDAVFLNREECLVRVALASSEKEAKTKLRRWKKDFSLMRPEWTCFLAKLNDMLYVS